MKVYEPGPIEDLLLLQWYNEMVESGDLMKAFTSRMHAVGEFMSNMRPPILLLYEADERGIWFASWYDMVMSAAVLGLWIRPDKRGPSAVPTLHESLAKVLEHTPVVMAITRNPKVVSSGKLTGFKDYGPIPHIWEGEPANLIVLTKEDFEEANYGRR